MNSFPALSGFRSEVGLVRLIGHRGARGVMPENTMAGFGFTLGAGVRALEFDVVLTGDGIPVVTHNHRLSSSATRTPDGQWMTGVEPKVSSLTYEEIATLDVGGLDGKTAYGKQFPDQAFINGLRVPRLAELLTLCAQQGNVDVSLLLELKSDPELKDDPEERAKLVAAVVADVRSYGLTQRTVLHSFDWALLDECRRHAPELPTSYLSELPANGDATGEGSSKSVGPDYGTMTGSLPEAVKAAGGQMWCPVYKDVTADLVAEAHGLGLLVATWTVNAQADIEAMIDAGVDGLVTDYPGRVQHCLLSRKLHWSA